MNCPHCGARRTRYVHLATGDWNAEWECGTSNDDNRHETRGWVCLANENYVLRVFMAAVIAADALATPSATADAIRELCKGNR